MQVFLHDLGASFYGVRTLAGEELFKVASLVIGGTRLPAFPEDANPFEGQGAEDDVVAFAFGFHVLVIRFGPCGVDDSLASPLDKGLAQEARGMPAPMDPSLAAALLDDRGESAILLQAPGVRVERAVLAESDQQPGLERLAGARQFPEEIRPRCAP